MRRTLVLAAAVAMLGPTALHAQGMDHSQHNAGMAAVKPLYESVKGFILRSVEAMPAEHHSFRPTESVRTWGQLLGHVANANFMFCATAKGEKSPATTNYEQATSREELAKGLRAAFEYCDSAYAMPEMAAMEEVA